MSGETGPKRRLTQLQRKAGPLGARPGPGANKGVHEYLPRWRAGVEATMSEYERLMGVNKISKIIAQFQLV